MDFEIFNDDYYEKDNVDHVIGSHSGCGDGMQG